jgi:hypothetical protein
LKLVKGKTITDDKEGDEEDEYLPHGAKIIKELVHPWWGSDWIVCANSYFASIVTAVKLKRIGLRFIGVVKLATRRYPMACLSQLEMTSRGEWKGLVTDRILDGSCDLMAFVWVDQDRQYFISTASNLNRGWSPVCYRWSQVDTSPDADPDRVEINIAQPVAAEV